MPNWSPDSSRAAWSRPRNERSLPVATHRGFVRPPGARYSAAMRPKEVRTAADARQIVEERDLDYVNIGFVDIDGIVRGKYISRLKFFEAMEEGIHALRDVLGFGIHDEVVETKVTGWHTGFPDAPMRIVPETCRGVPFDFDGRGLFFLCEYDGEAENYCTRSLLRRIVSKARGMGFAPHGGFECEFFLFKETPHSVREKGYLNLTTSTPGNFGYSVDRETVDSPFYQRLLSLFLAMDVPLEGFHEEVGPGAMEAAISAQTDVGAADRAVIFKTFTKIAAQREGHIATFMARWDTANPGQGAHIHLSLRDPDTGRPRFHLGVGDEGMNATLRHFIAGQQALLPEFFALVAPTINSYRRFTPGAWAPTAANWGVENRTCALRVIRGPAPQHTRIEFRASGADVNPYLAYAVALGSGLYGIEHRLEPSAPVKGNSYLRTPAARTRFPATLAEAAQRLRRSTAARKLFGDAFIDYYATTREAEVARFRHVVTDWERERYFEII